MTTTATPRPTTAARINPDNRLVLAGLLVVLVAVAAASFTLSFTGLSAAAPLGRDPRPPRLARARRARGRHARVRHRGVRPHPPPQERTPALDARLGPDHRVVRDQRRARLGRRAQRLAGHRRRRPRRRVPVHDARRRPRRRRRRPRPLTDTAPATDTEAATDADTTTTRDADTTTVAANAGEAETPAAVGGLPPFAVVVERAPALRAVDTEARDTAADGGHLDGVRTIRTAARGRVAERLDEIDRLALTTDLSGRAIADALGLGRASVCARVSAVRAGRTDTRTPDTDAVLLAV